MNGSEGNLRECEAILEDEDELQWRQVHPTFVVGETVSRDAFVGTSDATAEISTVRSLKVTAEEAHQAFVREGLQSAGTWAVSVQEVAEAGCRAISDEACDDVDPEGHSYIDMRASSKAERREARVQLASAATERGCCHSPT